MSEHEQALRAFLADMPTGLRLLEAIAEHQKTAALEDAMAVFSARQKEMQRQALGKGVLKERVADMMADAARASWALHVLRAEAGRRKKPPRVRAKKEAKG